MADKEYIEREALVENLRELHKAEIRIYNLAKSDTERRERISGCVAVAECIVQAKEAPTADVVEVRHERFEWGYQNGQYGIWCTNCGAGWVDSENAEWIAREHDYCPKCGAKMDGKGEE